jgi:hypothetical protein
LTLPVITEAYLKYITSYTPSLQVLYLISLDFRQWVLERNNLSTSSMIAFAKRLQSVKNVYISTDEDDFLPFAAPAAADVIDDDNDLIEVRRRYLNEEAINIF